ncbi:NmrA family NAD(P)-binding protein [Streptococcus panodentis]|uniref:NAD(P)-dependent oxidoreductase n=1 Tax=Streptococcus panodentis TaxID=1581472 RepID=A0ABS5AY06_9STRE|nr:MULTISPECIES: NmrA family NAD(P)-binding protein [Streptococcus]KXT79652.1 NADPH:quinone oxidoreductase 2 [Streptococcus sp. DD11]MBP2621459.1 NAD(P)-dependent oxidoreductase [Streptococcus panodentis]
MKYIITGCDGQLGGRVTENMLKEVKGSDLIVTCPFLDRLDPEKKERWEGLGIAVRQANYDNLEEMTAAFQGGDRIFIVSAVTIGAIRIQQHKNVVDAAIQAGVQHITYTSFLGASDPAYAHVYVTPDHTATESYIREAASVHGVDYNFMQDNLYLENYLTTSVMLALMSGNKWYTTAGEGRGTFIPKDDVARVAAALLLGKGQPEKTYKICGSESISQRDIAAIISDLSGISIEYCPVSHQEFYDYLDSMHIPREATGDYSQSPVPWCGNDMVTNEASIAEGLMDVPSDDVEILTGQKPMTARELAKNYAYIWEEKICNWKDIR